MRRGVLTSALVCSVLSFSARGDDLAARLARLDTTVVPADERKAVASQVADAARRGIRAANARSTAEWKAIHSRDDWERFRAAKLAALRESLGQFPEPTAPRVRVTGRHDGPGFTIENLVFESRPGLWVTANLYRPASPGKSMPAILISHAHHTPKEHGELQDMGMTWARAGCLVLVPDHLGHGERRSHPFVDATSFPKPYRVSRQDYYFRYDNGIRLNLLGDGLIGWLVWDLRRGIDVLLAQPGADPKRVILLGAVAGGGDPAAVMAALDERVTAAVPFNFGGPQPETRFPLPDDADAAFNYAGGGSWESTRNLRGSAAGGFLPWVIVGSVAPRPLVYAHEFAWDRPHDPVWKRFETLYGRYAAADRLDSTHGRGSVTGKPPEATHCTHIGPPHREAIHAAFRRWFGIDVTKEFSDRLPADKLRCLTPEIANELKPRTLSALLGESGDARIERARKARAGLPPAGQLLRLRADWSRVLGNIEPPVSQARKIATETANGITAERTLLTTDTGIVVPVLLLVPPGAKPAVVIAVSQAGKARLLRERSSEVAGLLSAGIAVCLPDVRGTGESGVGAGRGRSSSAAAVSSSLLMLGEPLVAGQLRDLRGVLTWLRSRGDLDAARPVLWGDSLAAVNPPGTNSVIPRDDDDALPHQAEPLGGLLAMLGALYDEGVRAVYVRGGLAGLRPVLDRHLVSIPHDAVIPGVLTTGDLVDVAAALAPKPIRLEGLVDGVNQRLGESAAREAYNRAEVVYRDQRAAAAFVVRGEPAPPARWIKELLR